MFSADSQLFDGSVFLTKRLNLSRPQWDSLRDGIMFAESGAANGCTATPLKRLSVFFLARFASWGEGGRLLYFLFKITDGTPPYMSS